MSVFIRYEISSISSSTVVEPLLSLKESPEITRKDVLSTLLEALAKPTSRLSLGLRLPNRAESNLNLAYDGSLSRIWIQRSTKWDRNRLPFFLAFLGSDSGFFPDGRREKNPKKIRGMTESAFDHSFPAIGPPDELRDDLWLTGRKSGKADYDSPVPVFSVKVRHMIFAADLCRDQRRIII